MNQIVPAYMKGPDARVFEVPFPRWTAIEVWTVRNGQDWAEISVGHAQPWTPPSGHQEP